MNPDTNRTCQVASHSGRHLASSHGRAGRAGRRAEHSRDSERRAPRFCALGAGSIVFVVSENAGRQKYYFRRTAGRPGRPGTPGRPGLARQGRQARQASQNTVWHISVYGKWTSCQSSQWIILISVMHKSTCFVERNEGAPWWRPPLSVDHSYLCDAQKHLFRRAKIDRPLAATPTLSGSFLFL